MEGIDMTIVITIIINVVKIYNKELQLQKKLISMNGQLMAALISQQHYLVGKWLMADHHNCTL